MAAPIIWLRGSHPTVKLAACELQSYLAAITKASVELTTDEPAGDQAVLQVGTESDVGGVNLPEVKDPRFDDAIYIDAGPKGGVIAGNQPRSVLLAVYRYLTELGCRFLRPGKQGELLCPPESAASSVVQVSETPSYRHRGLCIEGAVSREHVLDIIDWLPKVGMNSYFVQFREAYTFFERWYEHEWNPNRASEGFSLEQARAIIADVITAAKERDLLYQAVGHGWTTEPFGIHSLGWHTTEVEVPESVRPYLAEINGERTFFKGTPIDTNLCYSNPEVRQIINDDIVRYAEKHPHVDVLHFWLADGTNNQCECEDCRTALPADFYVTMLNELDQALSAAGLDTRIVFLVYVDLLWPPEVETIQHPDRFILMFAPITRTYRQPFEAESELPALPAYQRNQLQFPADVATNLAFLKSWQAGFSGDSFSFDYHFMWSHVFDPGYYAIAEVLHQDVVNLQDLELNGFISCQAQRVFFPHGLGMAVLGQTLWDRHAAYEDITADYFAQAYGPGAAAAREHFERLSALARELDTESLNRERLADCEAILKKLSAELESFDAVVKEQNRNLPPAQCASWLHAAQHNAGWMVLVQMLDAARQGDTAQVQAHWDALKRHWAESEAAEETEPYFDRWNTIRTIQRRWGKLLEI